MMRQQDREPIKQRRGRESLPWASSASRSRELQSRSGILHAVGALAFGAIAIGAAAIGAVAIGRLTIGRGRIRRLEIDELVVRRLHVKEIVQMPPAMPASPTSESSTDAT
jgi:hypothetical protein